MTPVMACRLRDEDGMTLVELMVSASLLVIILGIVYGVLASMQRGVETNVDRNVNQTQARLAMESLGREIPSAAKLWILPATADRPAGSHLVIYTQSNFETRGNTFVCEEWRVDDDGNMWRRYWPLAWEGREEDVTSWMQVASDVRNYDTTGGRSTTTLFTIPSDSEYGGRLVQVDLVVNTSATAGTGKSDFEMTNSFTGRNVQYSSAVDCTDNRPDLSDSPAY